MLIRRKFFSDEDEEYEEYVEEIESPKKGSKAAKIAAGTGIAAGLGTAGYGLGKGFYQSARAKKVGELTKGVDSLVAANRENAAKRIATVGPGRPGSRGLILAKRDLRESQLLKRRDKLVKTEADLLKKAKFNKRLGTAGAIGAGIAATAYGVHKYRKNKRNAE